MIRERNFGVSQLVVIFVIAVIVAFGWDFKTRLGETITLIQEAQTADAKLQEAERINAQLKQLKKDVTTDEWVIKKARVDLHYARENETLVIPAVTPPPPSAQAKITAPTPPPRPFWHDWLEAVFGPTHLTSTER